MKKVFITILFFASLLSYSQGIRLRQEQIEDYISTSTQSALNGIYTTKADLSSVLINGGNDNADAVVVMGNKRNFNVRFVWGGVRKMQITSTTIGVTEGVALTNDSNGNKFTLSVGTDTAPAIVSRNTADGISPLRVWAIHLSSTANILEGYRGSAGAGTLVWAFTNLGNLIIPAAVASNHAVIKSQMDAAIAASVPTLKTVNGNTLIGTGDVSVGDIKQGGNTLGQGMIIQTLDQNSVTIGQGGTGAIAINGPDITLSRTRTNISGDMYLSGPTSGIKKADGTNYIVDGVINASANTTITNSNFGGNGELILYVNASSAALTLTLPTPTDMQSRTVRVIKVDSSVNAVTIKGNGTTNINGSNTYMLTTQYQNATVKTNGTQYYLFNN